MRKAFSQTDLLSNKKIIDHEVQQVQRQIALAEKTNANLLKDFTNITVDLNRLFSRQQELYLNFDSLTSEESPVLQESLNQVSVCMNSLQSSLKRHIDIIQERIVRTVSEETKNCRDVRHKLARCSDMKKNRQAAVKVLEKSKKLDEKERKQQTDVLMDSTKHINELTTQMKSFERNKAQSLKKLLKTFLHSNLAYHAKAMEMYTKAYQAIDGLDVEKHVEYFVNNLNYPVKEERAKFVRWNSFNSVR